MRSGAGTGPGLDGSMCQEAGSVDNGSKGTASAGSRSVTETAVAKSTSKKSDGVKVPVDDLKGLAVIETVILSLLGGMVIL